MPNLATTALLLFFTALLVTTILTFLSLPLVKKFGLIDDPKLHKHPGIIHIKPIPRGGGIPIFFGALFTSFFFLPFNSTIIAVFFAAFLVMSIGLIDDKFNA